MTNASLEALDQQQLLDMALSASGGGDSATAIACWSEAAARPDAGAMTHYLLGAEYAQVRRYDYAIAALEAALALDPALHAARLQLGMLYLGADDAARGAETLAPLERLDERQALRHFAAGLLALTRGETAAALAALQRGLDLNTALPALNGDMRRIMGELGWQGGARPTATPAAEESGLHVLLSAYTSNRLH